MLNRIDQPSNSLVDFISWFGRLFLILQGLELVLDVPVSLLEKAPSFLLQMPVFGLLVDWSVLAAIVSLVSAIIAFIIAASSWALIRGGVVAEVPARKVIVYSGVFIFIASAVYDIWEVGFPNFQLNILPRGNTSFFTLLLTALVVVPAVRYADFENICKRLTRCGTVYSLVIVPLLLVAVISGVRFGDGDRVLSAPAPFAERAARRPNIIYVVSDALSANAMSLYGETLSTTPQLEKLSKLGVTVNGMTTVDNWTAPTTATLYSGVSPARHGIFSEVSYFIDDKHFTKSAMMPAQLRSAGYRTYSVIQNGLAAPFHMHFEDQFDETRIVSNTCGALTFFCARIRGADVAYTAPMFALFYHGVRLAYAIYYGSKMDGYLPPEDAYRAALDVIDNDVKKDHPFLLWIHVFAPHGPYLSPRRYRQKFDKTNAFLRWSDFHVAQNNPHLPLRYRENVSYADASFAEFYQALKLRNLLQDSVLVFSADHGETFNHWMYHDGPLLNEDLIRIPFVIWGPSIPKGKVVKERVSEVDVAPTMLAVAGLRPPAQMEGRSLMPLIQGRPFPSEPVFAAALNRNGRWGRFNKGTFAMVNGAWKYVQSLDPDGEQLFNLADDPREEKNLAERRPDILARMRYAVDVHFAPRKAAYGMSRN